MLKDVKAKIATAMRNIAIVWTIVDRRISPRTVSELASLIDQEKRPKGKPAGEIMVGYKIDGPKLQLFYEKEAHGSIIVEADDTTSLIKLEIVAPGNVIPPKLILRMTWDFDSGTMKDLYEKIDDYPREITDHLMGKLMFGLIMNPDMRNMVFEIPSGEPHACGIYRAWCRSLSDLVERLRLLKSRRGLFG